MKLLTYNEFINESGMALAAAKARNKAKTSIFKNKDTLIDVAKKVRDKSSEERGEKISKLDDKIKQLMKKRNDTSDPERRKEIQKEIQKYSIQKRKAHKLNQFCGT